MKYLAILLALTSFAFSQTKTVGPSGEGITSGTRSAFLDALGGTTAGKSLFQITGNGTSGQVATSNGSGGVSWATVTSLPSQTSNSGKFLTTNGTAESWASITSTTISDSTTAGRALLTDADAAAQRTSLGLGTAATADASTTGGALKLPQFNASGDLTTGAFANDGVLFNSGGNIYIPDMRGIQFLRKDGTLSGQKILGWDEHGGARATPEMILESPTRIALIPYGGMQYGPNDPGRFPRYIQMVSGGARDTPSGMDKMPSGSFLFQTSVWNGSASVASYIGMQAHALDTTNTNSVLKIYDQSDVYDVGDSNTAGRGDLTGTVMAEVYKDGIWSPGTAPTFSALTTGGATITQTCSKYKTVQTAKFTLDGNRTLEILNPLNGMRGVIYVTQPSSGAARTLALPNGGYLPSGWTAPYADLSTTNGHTDRLEWEYDNSSFIWTVSKGLVATYTATDTDAAAYIAAVETAKGSSLTVGQKAAIDTFVIAEKAGSRWTSQKRLYLPIWANAAANAIDMKTLAVGTFVNSPTQGAGYIQGNASTQYFDMGASASTLGMTLSSNGMTILATENNANNSDVAGASTGSDLMLMTFYNSSALYKLGNVTQSATLATSARTGIFDCNRVGTTTAIYNRRASGNTTLVSSTLADGGSIPSGRNMWALGMNAAGTLSGSAVKTGAISVHSGFSSSDSAAFTGNLKTLWETCTGLTLP